MRHPVRKTLILLGVIYLLSRGIVEWQRSGNPEEYADVIDRLAWTIANEMEEDSSSSFEFAMSSGFDMPYRHGENFDLEIKRGEISEMNSQNFEIDEPAAASDTYMLLRDYFASLINAVTNSETSYLEVNIRFLQPPGLITDDCEVVNSNVKVSVDRDRETFRVGAVESRSFSIKCDFLLDDEVITVDFNKVRLGYGEGAGSRLSAGVIEFDPEYSKGPIYLKPPIGSYVTFYDFFVLSRRFWTETIGLAPEETYEIQEYIYKLTDMRIEELYSTPATEQFLEFWGDLAELSGSESGEVIQEEFPDYPSEVQKNQ